MLIDPACVFECMLSVCVCVYVCMCLLPVLLARFLLSVSEPYGEQIAVKRVHVCGFHIKINPRSPKRVFTAHTSMQCVMI